MSDSHAKRDSDVFKSLYMGLLEHFSSLFKNRLDDKVIEQIKDKKVKLVDASIMSVCLNLFSWATIRTAKGGIKMHVSLDKATMIPEMINLIPAKVSDRRSADNFRYPKDTIVVDDRGYFDFGLFATRIEDENHFVTRMKSNTVYESIGEIDFLEKAGIDQSDLRRVAIYKKYEHKRAESGTGFF